MYGYDDSDMKIVGAPLPPQKPQDEGEEAADLYSRELNNGNLNRAHEIGKLFAKTILSGELLPSEEREKTEFEQRNILILFAFVADQAINHFCPNTMTAQSAENEFYNEIRTNNPSLYESVSRSGAFSIYLLCQKGSEGKRNEIGKAYAKIIRKPDDKEAENAGERLYKSFWDYCFEHFKNIEFTH